MSRTYRKTTPRPMSKEKKVNRKLHTQQYRAQVKRAMCDGDWDNIPQFKKTCGWLTW